MLPAPPADVPPPSPPSPAASGVPATARPGELTFGWRAVVGLTWAGIFLGWSAIWKASRDVGLATWWLGPAGEPRPLPVMLLPFVGPGAMVVAVIAGSRFLPWAGLAASAVAAAIALGDIGRVPGLGLAELALAVGGAAVSVASFGGRYRPAQ